MDDMRANHPSARLFSLIPRRCFRQKLNKPQTGAKRRSSGPGSHDSGYDGGRDGGSSASCESCYEDTCESGGQGRVPTGSRSVGRGSGEGSRGLQPGLREMLENITAKLDAQTVQTATLTAKLDEHTAELQSLQKEVSDLQRSPPAQPPTTELLPEGLHQELPPPSPSQQPQNAGVLLLHMQELFGRAQQLWGAARGHAAVTPEPAIDDSNARGHAFAALACEIFFAASAIAIALSAAAAAAASRT